MTYSSSTRDRYRLAISAVTGATVVGALTTTGWLAGQAAQAHAADVARQRAAAQQQDKVRTARAERARARYDALVSRSAARRSALRHRPTRTRVTTRYVTPSGAPTATVGGGGTVSPPTSAPAAPAAPAAAAPAPAAPAAQPAPPPPPPPPPPPAPSGGSTP